MGTVRDDFKPTLENVTTEFLIGTLYDILFDKETPDFLFEFRETESINFIVEKIENYAKEHEWFNERKEKILLAIKTGSKGNDMLPVIVVDDYKEFFESLRKCYEKDIELFFLRTGFPEFLRYEMKNLFLEIWIRMTPEDFNNPEEFLKKSYNMMCDKTFEKYDNTTFIGTLKRFDNHVICVKNGVARTWDEAHREFVIELYHKNYYYKDINILYKPHIKLPVIRYGVYEKDGKKVCCIASIQDTDNLRRKNKDFEKEYEDLQEIRGKFRKEICIKKLKKNLYKNKVEPLKILSLSIFVNFLHKEGITYIEVPSMFVLDYDYHIKTGKSLKKEFDKKWPMAKEEVPVDDIEDYTIDLKYLLHNFENEDVISEIKTERLISTTEALMLYYDGNIISYPGEVENFLRINIPISEPYYKDTILKDMYDLLINC